MVAWKGPDGDVLTSLLPMVKHLMTGAIWKTGDASMPRTCLGLGRVPVILNIAGMERKALMCTFAAFHYRIACRQDNAAVPWGAIGDNVDAYISKEYLPPM
ncbi:hypothetical protein V8B97DRAFT_1920320 [Scleroderma yunnanense]